MKEGKTNNIDCMKTIRIKVHGKVQGVWYRKSTHDQAKLLEVNGWVKNEPDRTVLIEASGTAEALNEFINWCHQGPPLARVTKVEVSEIDAVDFDSFEIIR